MNPVKKPSGFTLIEVLVALVILAIALLSLAGLMVSTTGNNSGGAHLTEAATLAQDALERLRLAQPLPSTDIATTYNTTTVAPSGINYTWGWTASNPVPSLETITITVNWTDPIKLTSHTITMVSAFPLS